MRIGKLNIGWGKSSGTTRLSRANGQFFYEGTGGLDLAAVWGKYSDNNLLELFHSLPEVFAPVHEIASRVAGVKYELVKVSNDEVYYKNVDVNRLLSTPNPLQNFQQLLYESEVYELVTGKNFMFTNVPDSLTFDYKNMLTLLNLAANAVTIETDPRIKLLSATTIGDIIKGYKYYDGTYSTPIPPEKVMYTKFTSFYLFDNKILGRSPLLSASKPIDNLIAVYEARNVIYRKRGALGIIVSRKEDESGMIALTKPEKDEITDEFNNSYGLGGNKKPIAVTTVPVDFIKIAASIQELQPFEETEADAAAIYAVLQVPREMMPKQEGATFENQNQAEKGFYERVIKPRANSKAQSLTNFMQLQKYGFYLRANFDDIQVLQEDKKEKSDVDWRNNETSRVRFSYGIVTLNEWKVSAGGEKSANPLYDKLIFEMKPEELEIVKQVISLKAPQQDNSNNQNQDSNAQGNKQ